MCARARALRVRVRAYSRRTSREQLCRLGGVRRQLLLIKTARETPAARVHRVRARHPCVFVTVRSLKIIQRLRG